MSYEIVNGDSRQFTTPFLKVALCLSYMNGPKLTLGPDTGTLAQSPERRRRVHDGPVLWDDFEADFRRAYANQRRQAHGVSKIERAQDARDDIAPTLQNSNRLIDEAGYSRSDIGVLQKFKEVCNPHSSGKS